VAVNSHGRARLGQPHGQNPANAARSPGNQSGFSFQRKKTLEYIGHRYCSLENRNSGEMKELKELKGIFLISFISLSPPDFHSLVVSRGS
jgi:hypothetical protein